MDMFFTIVFIVTMISSFSNGEQSPMKQLAKSGTEIKLKCARKAHLQNHLIVWEFLPCGLGYNKTKCATLLQMANIEDSWQNICAAGTKFCKINYIIENSTSEDSGLYRCSIQAETGIGRSIVGIYEIDVIDPIKDSGPLPEFVDDNPKNLSISEGKAIVQSCLVTSLMPPQITWLKEVYFNEFDKTSQYIQYLNKKYKTLNSSGATEVDVDIYKSKLIIPSAKKSDSGNYVILAINYKGIQLRSFTIYVKSAVSELENSTWKQNASFSLLFLIPLCLALIPVPIWLCYKKRAKNSLSNANSINTKYTNYKPVNISTNIYPYLTHENYKITKGHSIV